MATRWLNDKEGGWDSHVPLSKIPAIPDGFDLRHARVERKDEELDDKIAKVRRERWREDNEPV